MSRFLRLTDMAEREMCQKRDKKRVKNAENCRNEVLKLRW